MLSIFGEMYIDSYFPVLAKGIEDFSFIVAVCTISVITVYNTPWKNHNFLMQQYFSMKFIQALNNQLWNAGEFLGIFESHM